MRAKYVPPAERRPSHRNKPVRVVTNREQSTRSSVRALTLAEARALYVDLAIAISLAELESERTREVTRTDAK